MPYRLVILDRDGVINHDSDKYVKTADEWQAIDGSLRAIGELTSAGFTVVVATNQSGLGRHLYSVDALAAIHEKMREQARSHGGEIRQIVFCPHRPDDECACRKPQAGMLKRLGRMFDVSLEGVPVIGDSLRDVDAATAVNARPLLVLTGNGEDTAAALEDAGRVVETFADLAEAARSLIAEHRAPT